MSGNLPLFDAGGEAGLSPAAAVAAALLHSAAAPLASAQLRRLWPSKPLPKPAALEAALEELAQRGAASRLPGRGGKPVWSARPLAAWLEDARERILRAAGGSPQPVKEKDLLAAAGWPKELDPAPVRELLGRLEQE
ncbi:MAG: hypothetical protein N2036_07610, partial [Bryobacteraceae bacterium]|nr:hypothetical protein [Bryobacteraceae bacterium]